MIQRGEIRSVDFEPSVGSEAAKRRPAVVVSNDAANETASATERGVITVVPLTSSTKTIYPFQVLLPATGTTLGTDSKAQAEEVRSIDFSRIGETLAIVSERQLREIDQALRLHLSL